MHDFYKEINKISGWYDSGFTKYKKTNVLTKVQRLLSCYGSNKETRPSTEL